MRSAVAVGEFLLIGGVALPLLLLPRGTADLNLSDGLPVFQVALALLHALCLFFLIKRYWSKAPQALLLALTGPVLLIALALASSAWSELPMVSLRRGVALAGTVTFAAFLSFVLGLRRSLILYAWYAAISVVLSLLFIAAAPNLGIHQTGGHVGNWRGAYLHKNLLGREMALALVVITALLPTAKREFQRYAYLLLCCGALALVIGAQSATGIVATGAVIVSTLVSVMVRHNVYLKTAISILVAGVAVGLSLFLVAAPDMAFSSVGRDATLTGRTYLWDEISTEIAERPLVGYGYGTFWNTSRGTAISDRLGWRVVHGHNGVLDVILNLGFLGLLAVGVIVLRPAYLMVRHPAIVGPLEKRVFGGLLLVVGVVSVADTVLVGPNNLFFAFLMVYFFSTEHAWRSTRRSSRQPGPLTPTVGTEVQA